MEASGVVYECKAKGVFRKNSLIPMVGDQVELKIGGSHEDHVISKILPRKNAFIRPPVANVDVALAVAAAKDPKPNFSIIDKLLVTAEKNDAEAVIVFNKMDQAENGFEERVREIYRNTGYPIFFVSAEQRIGLDDLRNFIRGKKSMLAGPSGVGKSSLVNAMEGFRMETGSISEKTLRGKHTTRHVELLYGVDGVKIFDTPGFTSFSMLDLDGMELKEYFPEFEGHSSECKFNSCVHIAEPGCMVKRAVEAGAVSPHRYESYTRLYQELKEKQTF